MLETLAQAVINGLLIGGIYALVSIGVTLIFGVVKIVNFAQGEFVMIGMYITFFLASRFGIDPLVSLAVSIPVLFVVGALIAAFPHPPGARPRRHAADFFDLRAVVALDEPGAAPVHARITAPCTPRTPTKSIHLGALYVPVAKLIAFALAMAFSGILWLFLHATDLGKAMRAAAQNPDVAMLMGINPHRVFAVAFGAALALAGAAGSLLMPFYPASPMAGQVFVLMAFVAVVLGTLGNVIGALIASLMMGIAESLGIQFVGADFGLIVVFVDAPPDAGDQAERPRRRAGAMTDKHRTWLWLGALTAIVLALPLLVTSRFAIDIFIRILLFAFIGVAWNLMGGYAKQLSLGHAAYFGLGAYTSTILQIRFGISPWIGMVAGGVVAMLASLPIGWLCFRLRGPYFAIATIATAQVLMLLFLKFRDFAWGAEGTTIPNFGDAPLMMQFDDKSSYYYVALGLLALGLIITYRIEHSWMGYYLVAIGEDEDAAEAVGVNAPRIKRDIYMISAFLTALAGTFYVQYIYFIDPATAFSFNISVEAALVSIVGGIGTLWGPVDRNGFAGNDLRFATKLARQQRRWRTIDRLQPDPDCRHSLAADPACSACSRTFIGA